MKKENERALWQIRFERILELEQESFDFYQKLLTEKKELLKKTGLKRTLQRIKQDEGKHIQIAKDLIRLAGPKEEG